MEYRFLEVRAEETDGQRVINGLIPYNSRSLDLGGFAEVIQPGAFARTLRDGDQVALWSHDTSKPLGRRSRGTLVLQDVPDVGLRMSIYPPDTTWGRDAYESVKRGDVADMSFGFTIPKGGDVWKEESGAVIRALVDVDLKEVSPVVFGAYPQSHAQTRDRYGDIPAIPAAFCVDTSAADTGHDDHAGALDINKRHLELLSIGGTK